MRQKNQKNQTETMKKPDAKTITPRYGIPSPIRCVATCRKNIFEQILHKKPTDC